MEVQCSFCGSPLKDDARYCNRCGTLIASHPFSPRSASNAGAASDKAGRTKFEQYAGQSPNDSAARRVTQDEPPLWMSQLENGLRSRVPSGGLESEPQEKAPEIAKAFMPEPDQHTDAQVRNLRVQVWEQDEPMTQIANGQSAGDDLEELPTSPLVACVPEGRNLRNAPVSIPGEVEHERFDGVELVDTVQLATQLGKNPMATPMPVDQTMQQEQFSRQHFESYGHSSNQSIAPISAMYPRQESQPIATAAPPAQEWRQTPPPQVVVAPIKGARRRKKGRSLVTILAVCLLLVVLGGLGAWIILYHPFTVPGITQPQQSFTDSQLGFSLSYPNGWQTQVDRGKTTVHFYDSSHTAQVDVVVGRAAGGDPGAYLQQKANQLGLTGLKNSSTSIGGASWQRIQGNALIRGASYTETLLATVHKNSIYTIILLAPQSIFEQEEQLVFAKMYSSFLFV